MFSSRFLTQAADRNPINATPAQRSKLFMRRAAMRCNPVSEPPSIPPMTAALVSVADKRTTRPEVPSIYALVTADVETATEAQDVVQVKGKKSGRKRKNEVAGASRRKTSGSKTYEAVIAKSGTAVVNEEAENSRYIPEN